MSACSIYKQVDIDKGENYELIYHEVPQHLYRDYIIPPTKLFVKHFFNFLCKLYVKYYRFDFLCYNSAFFY